MPRRRHLAALALLASAAIHAVLIPEHLVEAPLLGYAFIAQTAVAIVLAAVLALQDNRVAWHFGAVVCLATSVDFLVSRTTGLPGMEVETWDALGVASLVVQLGFVALALPLRNPLGVRGVRKLALSLPVLAIAMSAAVPAVAFTGLGTGSGEHDHGVAATPGLSAVPALMGAHSSHAAAHH
jgi:hypothetical protein